MRIVTTAGDFILYWTSSFQASLLSVYMSLLVSLIAALCEFIHVPVAYMICTYTMQTCSTVSLEKCQ